MNNYKTEQEKQDKEFERIKSLYRGVIDLETRTFTEPNFQSADKQLESHLLTRDTALLEAIMKDVRGMRIIAPYPESSFHKLSENGEAVTLNNTTVPKAIENLSMYLANIEDIEVRRGYTQALDDLLALLKDYNPTDTSFQDDIQENTYSMEEKMEALTEIPQMEGTLEALEKLTIKII